MPLKKLKERSRILVTLTDVQFWAILMTFVKNVSIRRKIGYEQIDMSNMSVIKVKSCFQQCLLMTLEVHIFFNRSFLQI